MKKIVVSLIAVYQRCLSFDSGLLSVFAPGGACRYSPSCSEYTKQAILKYGVVKGVWMGLRRILSCNPWNPSAPSTTHRTSKLRV